MPVEETSVKQAAMTATVAAQVVMATEMAARAVTRVATVAKEVGRVGRVAKVVGREDAVVRVGMVVERAVEESWVAKGEGPAVKTEVAPAVAMAARVAWVATAEEKVVMAPTEAPGVTAVWPAGLAPMVDTVAARVVDLLVAHHHTSAMVAVCCRRERFEQRPVGCEWSAWHCVLSGHRAPSLPGSGNLRALRPARRALRSGHDCVA